MGGARQEVRRAAWSIMLYREGDSPLRYKINRLGGRSKQEKWILQAELFNEIHRWVAARLEEAARSSRAGSARPSALRDGARLPASAAEKVWGDAWGNANYMVTRPVTIKAMLRVCADLAHDGRRARRRAAEALGAAALPPGRRS